jgi:hypothetical protein
MVTPSNAMDGKSVCCIWIDLARNRQESLFLFVLKNGFSESMPAKSIKS